MAIFFSLSQPAGLQKNQFWTHCSNGRARLLTFNVHSDFYVCQIGRIFSIWAIIYIHWELFKKYRSSPNFGATIFHTNSFVSKMTLFWVFGLGFLLFFLVHYLVDRDELITS
jgi:uncharacterized protein YybS (DUF2232 family)